MSQSAVINLKLKTPCVFNHLNPLESMIVGVKAGGSELASASIRPIIEEFVKFENDVPCISMPCPNPYEDKKLYRKTVTIYSSPSNIIKNSTLLPDFDKHSKTMKSAGDKNNSTNHHFLEADSISIYMTGDVDRFFSFIMSVGAIGAHVTKGYGMIDQGMTEDPVIIDTNDPIGIVNDRGELVRPIPVAMADEMGLAYSKQFGRWTIPFRPDLIKQMCLKNEIYAYPRLFLKYR